MSEYDAFVASKRRASSSVGFASDGLPSSLFDHQRVLVEWATRKGRAALFADTGLGKTAMQLAWAAQVVAHTGGRVLILAPLAVTSQTVAEGRRIGIDVHECRGGSDDGRPIVITNYEQLHHMDAAAFVGVVLDESSILKAYNGSTRDAIIAAFAATPYKLACTATPAPNDWTELGNHAEFLGVCSRPEMLATYFCHDGGETATWRLKGHAHRDFWAWVATWAAVIRRPSDLGFDDGGYALPPLVWHEHRVAVDESTAHAAGMLFVGTATTLADQRGVRRATMGDRVAMAASVIASEPDDPWLVWCEQNAESEAMADCVSGAVEVTGSDEPEHKTASMLAFAAGGVRVLVSKPRICGFGMNFQRCARVLFVGPSHSYEATYQAIRRCWRFGQGRPVHVHVVASSADAAIVANYRRKEADAAQMQAAMVEAMRDMMQQEIRGSTRTMDAYGASMPMIVPKWLAQDRGGIE